MAKDPKYISNTSQRITELEYPDFPSAPYISGPGRLGQDLLAQPPFNEDVEIPFTSSFDENAAVIDLEKTIFELKKTKENLNTEFTELTTKVYNVLLP